MRVRALGGWVGGWAGGEGAGTQASWPYEVALFAIWELHAHFLRRVVHDPAELAFVLAACGHGGVVWAVPWGSREGVRRG